MDTRAQLSQFVAGAPIEVLLFVLFALEVSALLSVPSVLLRRRGMPNSALAWILALFALPALGSIAWWAIGRTRIERRLRKHLTKKKAFADHRTAPPTVFGSRFYRFLPPRAQGESVFSTSGNCAELLRDGPAAFASIEKAIDGAQNCVHLLFYIFEDDATGRRICEKLIQKAKQGITVRVLLDGFGCQGTAKKIRARLAVDNIDVSVFLPSRLWPLHAPRLNFVNHRKIVTIDNRIGFTGGMNIGHEYECEWRDLMLRLEGPAVEGLNHIFLEDWYFATGCAFDDPPNDQPRLGNPGVDVGVVQSGPDTENWIHDAYFLAISQAKERLYLATPYFVPTQAILTALRTAAGRGVDVRLLVPSLSDVRLVMWASRSFYKRLIEEGVRIYEYPGIMMHAKALLQDDLVASIGTANVDSRSFCINFEVCSFVADKKIAAELAQWMELLFLDSREITLPQLARASTSRKLLESAAHLLSPLL